MSRLFTFGCSYTLWPWPTWADIVAHELKIPHQNWGLPGLGNVGINNRIIECDLKNNINSDDYVLVVWSSWTREDRFKVKKSHTPYMGWSCFGDVFDTYDKQFVDNYWSLSNDLYKNSTAIIQTNRIFDIKFNGHIEKPLVNDYHDSNLGFDEREKNLAMFFEPHIPSDGIYHRDTHYCKYSKQLKESHPDVLSHLNYTIDYIMPKLGRTMSAETIDYFTRMDHDIDEFTRRTDCSDRKVFNDSLNALLIEKYNWDFNQYHGYN